MKKKPKLPASGNQFDDAPTVREYDDRRILSQICDWWDKDERVSLVAFALRDDHEGGATAKTMITTSPHHGLEILYQVAKHITCNCGHPDCHITKTAAAVVATIELQMVSARGEKVALH
jgi:hypothetical protein